MYPPTRRTGASSSYSSQSQGTVVVDDPYRWLEQDSKERRAWALAQDRFSTTYLHQYSGWEALATLVKNSHEYAQFDAPARAQDNRWYWMARSGAQKQPVLYRSVSESLPNAGEDGFEDLESASELVFDANALRRDGSKSLANWALSPDTELFAFVICTFGSDTDDILVCSNVGSGQSIADKQTDSIRITGNNINNTGYSVFVWGPESNGLYYTEPVPLKREDPAQSSLDTGSDNPKILWHKLGSPQAEDEVLLIGEPGSMFEISTSSDGAYMLLTISRDTTGANKLWIAENKMTVNGPSLEWIKVKDTFDASLIYIDNDGPSFSFMTNVHSDRNYVVKWTFATESLRKPVFVPIEHIPESRNIFLRQYAHINANYAVAVYSHNVKDELYLLPVDGPAQRLDPDFVGSIDVTPIQTGFFASFVNYNTPGRIKRLDWAHPGAEASWKVWRDTKFEAFPLDDFSINQMWYPSKDNTSIPMFVLHAKSTKLDGTAPYLQYGYGSNNVSLDPFFSPLFLAFAHEFGGVVAIPNIRGGSEFGLNWSEAGVKAQKVNALDDFISATEYLVTKKYISSSKTAILGWSAGAELVAQSVARAPSGTFGCAIADKGPYDLLRFPLFTPGLYWTGIFGDPYNPQDFDFIYPLSSLHNVPSGQILPPTLLMTGGEDVRIDNLHGYKFAATRQHNAAHGSGIQLLKAIKGASHETGKSIDVQIEEDLVKLGFIVQSLRCTACRNRSWTQLFVTMLTAGIRTMG